MSVCSGYTVLLLKPRTEAKRRKSLNAHLKRCDYCQKQMNKRYAIIAKYRKKSNHRRLK